MRLCVTAYMGKLYKQQSRRTDYVDRNCYVVYNNLYYNKRYGWVSHKNFADKLTMSEAQGLMRIYQNSKIVT